MAARDTLPAAPRPLISWAWDQAKALEVDPDHGTAVVPLDRDEVTRRRHESPSADYPVGHAHSASSRCR